MKELTCVLLNRDYSELKMSQTHENNFYIIGTGKDYVKAMWREALSLDNVVYIESPMMEKFRGKYIFDFIESKLYGLRVNTRINLPGKFIWRKYYGLGQVMFDASKKNIIIFSDMTRLLSDTKYWKKLKKEYGLVYCLILLNSCRHDLNKKSEEIRRILEFLPVDIIYTFDKRDADEFGLEHFPSMLSEIHTAESYDSVNDFYFIGQKKNRLKDIVALYSHLTELGYKCLFRVTGADENDIKAFPGIIFNKPITYEESIKEIKSSKCIIDVKIPEQKGLSLRYFEAIIYNRLLLTNNESVMEENFYNPKYMYVYNDICDVAITDVFLDGVPDYKYKSSMSYSPIAFLKRLEMKI